MNKDIKKFFESLNYDNVDKVNETNCVYIQGVAHPSSDSLIAFSNGSIKLMTMFIGSMLTNYVGDVVNKDQIDPEHLEHLIYEIYPKVIETLQNHSDALIEQLEGKLKVKN